MNYLKVDYLRENYKCNTVVQCRCICGNISVGSQGRIGLCSTGGVWDGFVLFVCVHSFVLMQHQNIYIQLFTFCPYTVLVQAMPLPVVIPTPLMACQRPPCDHHEGGSPLVPLCCHQAFLC